MLEAGKMDRRISIEQKSVTKNDAGEEEESWSEYIAAWASKTDMRGSELFTARQDYPEVTTRWVMWYRTGIKHDMRINHSGVIYNIENVREIGRLEGLEIFATRQPD